MVYRDNAPATARVPICRKCMSCNHEVTAEARYCDWCGSQVCCTNTQWYYTVSGMIG